MICLNPARTDNRLCLGSSAGELSTLDLHHSLSTVEERVL